MNEMLDRPLPHSVEAERAILGSVILDNGLVHQAAELLDPGDFYIQAHRHVFRAMLTLAEAASAIDPILVGEELRRLEVCEQVGGVAFVSELSSGLPRCANLTAYAKVVREHSLSRQLVKVASKIASDALEGEYVARELLDRTRDHLSALDE